MPQFDSSLLEQGATRFQAQANAIIAKYAIFGLLAGAGLGLAIAGTKIDALRAVPFAGQVGAVAAIGLVFGISQGREKAFWIRLEVQRLLALVELLKATRIPEAK